MEIHIGEKIKEYREKAGVSQKKLGMSLGLSDKAISAYESGRTLPPLETLNRIAVELKRPLSFFLSDSNNIRLDERLESIENTLKKLTKEINKLKKELRYPEE
ncbi:helix-turn-helix transcriptional regulator [Candidatus Nomurabacteria bacterium]|uniref:Helix-turn-helix transcriptional regulator n=1 Tax=Candidatus Dojkabacteria bacterium TaxID=2099670 RepID=A0A955I2D0_9BACT|nr:helix-turn-helix transcriptional regulator [Candidatus Dojkabacteria bacterium]MCB9790130.1 helix-turn-helix transcriptional regulator [Candidatus Nomurabacteria bacterium]MCB9803350.1 helix-turn-helix transcriptional regulator [Candidatus Nomurabacteria bacterium]